MQYPISTLNKVKRGAKKANYTNKDIYAILDSTEFCHISFIYEGRAFVQPINFGRHNNKLYIHGSYKNRMTQALIDAKETCINVMQLDAMKLTRSAFHHSVNYHSAMIFGSVKELTSDDDKLLGLKTIINHFIPDRWEHCRRPNEKELKATRVVEINIDTASAKIATAPPNDNKADYELDYWAGTIPVKTTYGTPIPDAQMAKNAVVPEHITAFIAKKNG